MGKWAKKLASVQARIEAARAEVNASFVRPGDRERFASEVGAFVDAGRERKALDAVAASNAITRLVEANGYIPRPPASHGDGRSDAKKCQESGARYDAIKRHADGSLRFGRGTSDAEIDAIASAPIERPAIPRYARAKAQLKHVAPSTIRTENHNSGVQVTALENRLNQAARVAVSISNPVKRG